MKCNLPVTGREVDYPGDANILSTTDLDSRITYANDVFMQVSGFTRDELLGQPTTWSATRTCRPRPLRRCGRRSRPGVRGWGW
jgi:PAS domain-containing protein